MRAGSSESLLCSLGSRLSSWEPWGWEPDGQMRAGLAKAKPQSDAPDLILHLAQK